jgi:isopropylmalate/homocitrate/citramalate synthase
MNDKRILVIDQTIREGMQYRGMMFSFEERKNILEFQERLGIDICQAAYPPAHVSETSHLECLHKMASDKGYRIRMAGLSRAVISDVKWMVKSGFSDYHLHSGINQGMLSRFGAEEIFRDVKDTVGFIRETTEGACINLAFADVGRTDPTFLAAFIDYAVDVLQVDIVNLPDTSRTMAPNVYHEVVRQTALRVREKPARIAVHCHNDLGMANANTVMGVVAGATVVEACVLGIGERNGIADLYTVCGVLKDQGYDMAVKTEDRQGFASYYKYIQELCVSKTGFGPLNYNTPAFGDAVKTHVAGTHDIIDYGAVDEKKYFLNVLCGKHLVKSFLDQRGIAYDPKKISRIVGKIKDTSAVHNRPLTEAEVRAVVDEVF